jgi:hypothetical protein
MDPVTLATVLVAVVTGASEALSSQLLARLMSLVKRPWHRSATQVQPSALPQGEAELTALEAAPQDQQKALVLAQVLLARSRVDAAFGQALEQWWVHAEPVRAGIGNVTNTISGGSQSGPVLQGRDFSNLTFGATPSPANPNPSK